jgi:hypothetical protein
MAVLPPSAPMIVRSYRAEQMIFARWVVDVWLRMARCWRTCWLRSGMRGGSDGSCCS